MKISEAFRRAWKVWREHPGATLRFLVVELCMTLAPLVFLLALTDSALRPLAAVSALAWILWIPAVRLNAASVMQDALAGGSLFSLKLADFSGYGKKLLFGLKQACCLLLWSAPLIAGLLIARHHISGDVDGFTLLRMIRSFGGGDVVTGVLYLGLILLGLLLLLAVGCAFHSGDRHAFVLNNPGLLKKRRGGIMLCWLCALLAMLPLILAVAVILIRYFPVLMDLNGLVYGTVKLPSTRGTLIILAVGAVLTLPFLPLRSLITAAFVSGGCENGKDPA